MDKILEIMSSIRYEQIKVPMEYLFQMEVLHTVRQLRYIILLPEDIIGLRGGYDVWQLVIILLQKTIERGMRED